jgi:acyl-coenzyme A synthetase/AMP-(fatty) acid ligase
MQKLLDRPGDATVFVTPSRRIDAVTFLAEAAAVAATLPHRAQAVNLCRDRYVFALGLAAALLRCQVSLLAGATAPGTLARLTRDSRDSYILTDMAAESLDGTGLPIHRIAVPDVAPPLARVPDIPDSQAAIVVLTSGSTGTPMATRKSWGELVTRSRAAAARFDLRSDVPETLLGTVPQGHMYGLETTILLPLHAGIASWCGRSFYPADIAATLQTLSGRRTLVTTPLHLRALLHEPPPARPPDRIISATAPLEREMARQAERAWGSAVFEILGASELGSFASRRSAQTADWTLYPGLSLHRAGTGELVLQAPHAASRPLADRILPAEDRLHFRLLGRAGDVVKRGGLRASLEGLGQILLGIPGVEDGAFLAPDDLDENPSVRLAAFAVAPSHTPSSLMMALRAELEPAFLPRPLVLLDAMPRDALGKLPRAALLAALAALGRNGRPS